MSGIETMLLGSSLMSATAGASTVGLVGAGGVASLGAGSLFSGGSILSTISTGISLASAASSLFGGNSQADAFTAQSEQEARALTMSAREDELAAQEEELRGKQESNDMMDLLYQTVASQRLTTAANGVDVGFGTPVSVEASTRKLANLQMGVGRDDAQIRALARRRQAWARREESYNVRSAGKQKASAARTNALGDAGGALADLVSRRVARG